MLNYFISISLPLIQWHLKDCINFMLYFCHKSRIYLKLFACLFIWLGVEGARWVTVAWKRAVSDLQVAFCGKTCAAWQIVFFSKPFHELGMIGFYIDWICSPTGYDWKIHPKSFQWGVDMIMNSVQGKRHFLMWSSHSWLYSMNKGS